MIIKTINSSAVKVALATIVVLGSLLIAQATAQKSQTETTESSLAQVATGLHTAYGAVRFHREERYEDQIVGSDSKPARAPHIYRLEGQRFDRSSGTLIERLPNNVPTMYVATAGASRAAYPLAGFPNAEQNFNKLIADLHEGGVGGKQGAESRGLLCAEIVYGLSSDWWLDGSSNAKLKAAEHFFSTGSDDGLSLAEKWWTAAKGNRDLLRISTVRSNDVFFVDVPVFWAPVGSDSPPVVKLYRIKVALDGSCAMPDRPSIILQ